jgi:hypothetical protein
MEGQPVATLIDAESGASLAISSDSDEQGWRLIELTHPDDVEKAIATISIDGGELIRVRHDEEAIQKAIRRRQHVTFSSAVVGGVRSGSFVLPEWIRQIKDPVDRGKAIAKLIENGAFDQAPFEAVDMALSQSNPQIRGPVLSAAFGRLGGGVGGVEYQAAVSRLDSLQNGRDRDFAINGLAHGLVGRDPASALQWANSISSDGFRKVVVENVSRRIGQR